jgi:hypothetical protein
MRALPIVSLVLLAGWGCKNGEPHEPAPTATISVAAAASTAPSVARSSKPTPKRDGMSKLDEVEAEVRTSIPKGSGDYARAVALATLYERGDISFEQLQAAILAMKLPPHKLGDAYLMITPPPPPPGVEFDPKMMPKDWEGTWGVVAQAYHLGKLDKDEYDKLHRAAHPTCKH